jgi:hypothetical protein
MKTKQTAVQILLESMTTSDVSFYSKEIAIALQIEREQIVDAYTANSVIRITTKAEQYYNETYGGQDE